jgi:hypothetical protein
VGFLDNSSITVDAILTTKGRQILSQGGNFDITKFALSDEEIDYTMYDSTHPDGNSSFGLMIDNTSVLEATPNRTDLQSFLVDSSQMGSSITFPVTDWRGVHWGAKFSAKPVTVGTEEEEAEDYTFTIENTNIVRFNRYFFEGQPWASDAWFRSTDNNAFVAKGIEFRAQSINSVGMTTITVRGNVSGITKVLTVEVRANPDSSISPFNNTADVTDESVYITPWR